jgi:hypothetical protein
MRTADTVSELVGVAEVAAMLGVRKSGLANRRKAPVFPAPVAQLAAGPVWTREQIVAYAADRSDRLVERPAVEELAREALSVEDAAATLGVPASRVRYLAEHEGMPSVMRLRTGEIIGIPRDSLGLYARRLLAGERHEIGATW